MRSRARPASAPAVRWGSSWNRRPASSGPTRFRIGDQERHQAPDRDPHRRAFFGDLHVHTGLSMDARTRDVILTPDEVIDGWSPGPLATLTIDDFGAAMELDPEILLFGTGQTQRFPSAALMAAIMQRGVGFEVMDTAAACRTFNLLVAEYRRVVAALLVHEEPAE